MLALIGIVVVIASVIGGFLMAGGNLVLLVQPSEFVTIGGAAIGSMLVSTPPAVMAKMGKQLGGVFGKGLGKDDFGQLLAMLYQVFRTAQQQGAMALEAHFEKPAESSILAQNPKFLSRHQSVDMLADSIKIIIIGGMQPHDLEALMDSDIEVHHHDELAPAGALAKVADALPGLGIVAAVLGIVITMQAIDGPPEEIGHHVGAALVGTFLGILLSYGFAQPLAAAMETRVNDDGRYEQCIKAGVMAMYKGLPPALAVEFARRVLPHHVRPSFDETEKLCRGAGKGGAEQKAA